MKSKNLYLFIVNLGISVLILQPCQASEKDELNNKDNGKKTEKTLGWNEEVDKLSEEAKNFHQEFRQGSNKIINVIESTDFSTLSKEEKKGLVLSYTLRLKENNKILKELDKKIKILCETCSQNQKLELDDNETLPSADLTNYQDLEESKKLKKQKNKNDNNSPTLEKNNH